MSHYYGQDDYDYSRRRPANYHRHSGHFLTPEHAHSSGGGLHRTRSQGHAPAPIVNIYNDQIQDAYTRVDQSPGRSPPYSPSPERRGRRLGDDLIEEMAGMALRDSLRSRSRGRSDAVLLDRPDFYEWQLAQKEREMEELNRRQLWEKEAELKKIKDAAKQKADAEEAEREQKRIIQDWEEKRRKDAERAKADEARILEKMEREKREAKEEEKRIAEKIEREKREAKEKEEREWKEFLRKQKEKEDKQKADDKAEEEHLQTEMRRRLEQFGYTQAQIDIMVDEEKAKKYKAERRPSSSRGPSNNAVVGPWRSSAPVYAKVHRDYLSVDTLLYYRIPYEFDRVSSKLSLPPPFLLFFCH